MDKRKLAQAVKRIEYCYNKGMLGAREEYVDYYGKYCVIGCLFDDTALKVLKDDGFNGENISSLFIEYPNLEKYLGDTCEVLNRAQELNDDVGPLKSIKYLKKVLNAN